MLTCDGREMGKERNGGIEIEEAREGAREIIWKYRVYLIYILHGI